MITCEHPQHKPPSSQVEVSRLQVWHSSEYQLEASDVFFHGSLLRVEYTCMPLTPEFDLVSGVVTHFDLWQGQLWVSCESLAKPDHLPSFGVSSRQISEDVAMYTSSSGRMGRFQHVISLQ